MCTVHILARGTSLTATSLILLLSGCVGEESRGPDSDAAHDSTGVLEPGPLAGPEIPGMSGMAIRLRTDLTVGGQFQTRITNTGDQPFKVLAVSLDSPGFERLPFAGRPANYAPGAVIDLPTRYGPVICGTEDTPVEVDPLYTVLQMQRGDGPLEEVRVPLSAPDDIIDRIHTEECERSELLAAVGAGLGGSFTTVATEGRPSVAAELVLNRGTAVDDVSVTELRGNVLLNLEFVPYSAVAPELPAGQAQVRIPVNIVLTARGCDAHVLSEIKQPFLLAAYLSIAGGQPQYVRLDPTPAQRDMLWSYVLETCAIR